MKKLNKQKCSRSGRVEGCGIASTLQLCKKLAEVLNLVEETGTRLVPHTRGLISLFPKGEGSSPQK